MNLKKSFLFFVLMFFMGNVFGAAVVGLDDKAPLTTVRIKISNFFEESKSNYEEAQKFMKSLSQSPASNRIIGALGQSTIEVFESISKSITKYLSTAQKALEHAERVLADREADHGAGSALALNALSLLDSALKDEGKLGSSATLSEVLNREEDRACELNEAMARSSEIFSKWRQEHNSFREEICLLTHLKQKVDGEILRVPEKISQIKDALWGKVLSEGPASPEASEQETAQQRRERLAAAAEKRFGKGDEA